MRPAKIDLIDAMARGGSDDQPLTVTLGELRALVNPDTVRLNADLVHISKLATRMRDAVAQTVMELEDEGDRTYFGSTNDADTLQELQRDIESWDFERAVYAAERPDLYAQLRKLREQSELDLGIELLKDANTAFGNYTAPRPEIPVLEKPVISCVLLQDYANRLAKMAEELKFEAQQERESGHDMLSLLLIRIQLSVEETGEFAEALAQGDLEAAAKELVDMSYVTDGHYLTLGLGDLKPALYREVHRSNMSKLGEDGKPIISEAGRWVKGPNYSPAELGPIIAAAGRK